MSQKTFEKIKELLDSKKIEYAILKHKPVRTSEEAAKVRGIDLKSGAKSMIVRSEGRFYNFVLSAEKKINWSLVKEILKTNSVSLATPEEVMKQVDCEIGSVPPFCNIYGLKIYCDPSLLENEKIDFNAGLLNVSMNMKSEDWAKIVKPEIVEFAKD